MIMALTLHMLVCPFIFLAGVYCHHSVLEENICMSLSLSLSLSLERPNWQHLKKKCPYMTTKSDKWCWHEKFQSISQAATKAKFPAIQIDKDWYWLHHRHHPRAWNPSGGSSHAWTCMQDIKHKCPKSQLDIPMCTSVHTRECRNIVVIHVVEHYVEEL